MCLASLPVDRGEQQAENKENVKQDENTTVKSGAFPYKLGKLLGQGRFGVTRAAQHDDSGHKVAVKLIKKHNFDPEEIRLQRRLVHKNIIQVYDVFDVDDLMCIVIEHMPGGNLFEYLQSRPRLSEWTARRLFQQLLDAVEHCHNNMIVHRDIKAENILLDKDGNVKLADFGLAGEMHADEFLTKTCGSLNYAAPEMLCKECQYRGPEVDVWSCGVVLYALLTAHLPFNGACAYHLCQIIKAGLYSIPGYVSMDARGLLKKMLTVDQIARIDVAGIRQHEWFSTSFVGPCTLELHDRPELIRFSSP